MNKSNKRSAEELRRRTEALLKKTNKSDDC